MLHAQALQGADHRGGTGQLGTGFVGTVFAAAREPHDDHAGQNAQDQLGNDGRHVVGDALAFFVLEDHLVDEVADDAGEEHHEGVHHTLHQRQGDHVTVGHVADLVGQHGAHFIGREALQQALGHGYQRVVAVPAGGEGVGLVGREDTHFGHLDAGLARQLFDRLQQPLLVAGARLADDLGAGGHLRHPLGDEQRNQGAGEAEHGAEHQQAAEVEVNPVGGHEPVETEQAQGNACNQHHREVGGYKQQNAHHGCYVLLTDELLLTAGYIRCRSLGFNRATISNCVRRSMAEDFARAVR